MNKKIEYKYTTVVEKTIHVVIPESELEKAIQNAIDDDAIIDRDQFFESAHVFHKYLDVLDFENEEVEIFEFEEQDNMEDEIIDLGYVDE